MTRKPGRIRIVIIPAKDGDESDAAYSGPATVLTGLPQTIRRREFRVIFPLADSTIYEMEQRGEFPRRFSLSPRCVVWDLEEVEAWLIERRRASDQGRVRRTPPPDVRLRRANPVRSQRRRL